MIGIRPLSILNKTSVCFTYIGAYVYSEFYDTNLNNGTKIYLYEKETFNVSSIIMTLNLLKYIIEWMQDNNMIHASNET